MSTLPRDPQGDRYQLPANVPLDRVFAFNYRADPRYEHEPWAVLHELHGRPPIFYSPDLGGHWVVSRMEMIKEILRNTETFATRHAHVPPVEREVMSIPHHVDPPEHSKYRKRVMDVFAPEVIAALRSSIRATAIRLTESFASRGHCEFISEFAQRLPIETFIQLSGISPDRRDDLISWVKGYAGGVSSDESEAGHQNLIAFLKDWLDQQLADPGSQSGYIVPALAAAEVDGRPLTRDEILSIAVNIFGGGFDTIASQMSHIVRFLAEHPHHRQQLIDDPASIPDAIEELLRRFSIISIARLVKHDTDFYGVTLNAGDQVLLLITASGIDECVFPNAMEVDFERPNRKLHCAFGIGTHVCPGRTLARVELQLMLEEVLPRLPNLRVQPGAEITYYGGMATGARNLPLAWDTTVTV